MKKLLQTYMAVIAAATMIVGIGLGVLNINANAEKVNTPQLTLASVPVGTILPYAGDKVPDDKYMVCNGQALSSAEYPELFAAIGTLWGAGYIERDGVLVKENTDFSAPDLRGMFLRGWNGDRKGDYADPDADKREASSKGGAVENCVGTVQPDALQKFEIHNRWGNGGPLPGGRGSGVKSTDTHWGGRSGQGGSYVDITGEIGREARLAAETRPKNASVLYIIRCK